MIYVMSDLHGYYEPYIAMLEKIQLQKEDTLYILGDVIDRGPDGIRILQDMMKRRNVVGMMGNHELMAYRVLSRLCVEVTEENAETQLDYQTMCQWQNWMENGGRPTQDAFSALHHAQQMRILEYIEEFSVYETITVDGREFVLVHGGLHDFSLEKELWEYELYDMVWTRGDYEKVYYPDKYLVTGHTPTCLIDEAYRGRIYRKNNHIAIDCGMSAHIALGCICLDTMEEFYVL
ncbi:MAG: fructose-bisphosphatase class III [Ruminococcaceae bacterium]|nr:fructose-bisphosphatase class III [Oscillospiraceae bacterium]